MTLAGERVLVTGTGGSLGSALVPALEQAGAAVVGLDIDEMDVRDADDVWEALEATNFTLVFHLAAMKHAPDGETDPAAYADTNIGGTANILAAAEGVGGARVILASSCKACDPETVYGASKLIAERMVLNAGGSVARFFNIPESSGNVFELWRNLPEDAPIPVTPCSRYFNTLDQAIELLLATTSLLPGRYCADPGAARWMTDVAHDLYPGRAQQPIPPRRGDRLHEPLHASHERMVSARYYLLDELPYLIDRIESPYDPVPATAAVAA